MTIDLEEQLAETVGVVRGRIRDHKERLKDDEWVTRVALVDPVLRTLGWEVGDLELVEVEHNYSRGKQNVDYALWAEPLSRQRVQKPAGLVEAKKLSDPLKYGDHKDQVDKYRYYTPCVALTNGDLWKVYRTAPVDFDEGAFLEFRITVPGDDPVGKLLELRTSLTEPDWTPPPEGLGWVPLGAFKPPRADKKKWWQSATEPRPRAMKFLGSDSIAIDKWPQIVTYAANWLIEKGLIHVDQEIMRPGNRAPLVTSNEPSPDQRRYWKRIGTSSSYVYAQGGAGVVPDYVKHLLRECGQSLDEVYLQGQ